MVVPGKAFSLMVPSYATAFSWGGLSFRSSTWKSGNRKETEKKQKNTRTIIVFFLSEPYSKQYFPPTLYISPNHISFILPENFPLTHSLVSILSLSFSKIRAKINK